MTKRKDITVVLRIDDKERVIKLNNADAHVKKLQHSLDNVNAKKLGGVFNGIDLSLKNIAMSMGLAFGASQIFSFIKDSVQAYGSQEKALNRLKKALENATLYSDKFYKELQDQASEFQILAGVADDSINDMQTKLISFGATDKNIKRVTAAVLDLSAGADIDLNAATLLVGKAIAGNITAFTRYGISIKKGKTEAETLSNVLLALEERYGGQAQAKMEGFDGKVTSLNRRFEDFQEIVGKLAVPALEQLLIRTNEALGGFEKFATLLDKMHNGILAEIIKDLNVLNPLALPFITGDQMSYDEFVEKWNKDADEVGQRLFTSKELKDRSDFFKNIANKINESKESFGAPSIGLNFSTAITQAMREQRKNWDAQNKKRGEIKEQIKKLNEELEETIPGSADEARVQNQIKSLEKLIAVTKDAGDANKKLADLRKELAVKLQSGMDAELVKLKQWYDEKLLIAAGNKDLQLMLEKSYWIQRREIIGKATNELDKLISMLDKKSMLLDRYRKTGKVNYEAPLKDVEKPDPLGYVDIAEQEQQLWEDTHFIAMSVMDGVRAASRTMWSEFVIGGRQAKDGWDAIWLSMRNTALQSIGDILTTGIFDYLRGAGKASKAGGNGKGNIFTDIFSFLSSFIPFLGEGGVVTKPTLAVVGDKKEAIIPLNRMNQFNFGQAADISRLVNKMDELKFAFTDKQWQLDMRKMYTVQKKINTNYNKRKV